MNSCQQWDCPNINIRGYCNITACSNPALYKQMPNTISQKIDSIIFPKTIGNITFHTSKELIDWVYMQQDPDYGMGNGA